EIHPDTKTIDTAVGPLPISPFLDPTWRKARDRTKKKTPPNMKNFGRFQKFMSMNAWAQLLAQPVRTCHITRTRLPKPFLQDFGLVKSQEADELWWIPAEFNQEAEEDAPIGSEEAMKQAENDDSGAISDAPAQTKGRFFAPAHTLARRDLLLEFLNKKSKYSSAYMRFSINPSIAGLVRAAAWREDMDEVISNQLRRQIVDQLIYLSQLCETGGRRYLNALDIDQARADLSLRRSCFLSLGNEGDPFDVIETEGVPQGVCPVYNMPKLLGSENVDRLRTESAIFKGADLVLMRGRRTYDLNKQLWRLQGFLA
ncbi:hypothetical protein M406DRAFT_220820, partial [Cryphonectria parasitica EP155]